MAFNLPPGCSTRDLPGEQPAGPCAVCGGIQDPESPDDQPVCICLECPECGDAGNPECYEKHGMRRSLAQEAQLAEAEAIWAQGVEIQAVIEAPALPVDPAPQEILDHIRCVGRCIYVISRAYAAGIKPTRTAAMLVAAAQSINEITDKWTPPPPIQHQ